MTSSKEVNKRVQYQANDSLIITTGLVVTVLLGTGYYLSGRWVNFPFIDDYQTIVEFLNHTQTDSLAHTLGYTIWQPHNEHRIVFTRLVAAAYAYLSPDGVRFDVLSASGLLFRGLILWSLYQQWQRMPVRTLRANYWSIVGFAAVVFIITSGRDMENVVWATCALQNIPVVAWGLLAFAAASRNQWTAAWVLGGIATLTSGNGIFVPMLLSMERLINRRWLTGSVAIAVSMVVYGFYRSGMHVAIDWHQLPEMVPKFFAFQGSLFYLHYYLREYGVPYDFTTVLAGLIYTAVGLETIWSYLKKRVSLFYPAVFAFIWLTALPVAMLRPGVLESRFAVYSMVLTGVVYGRLTEYCQLHRPNWLRVMHPIALIGALIFFVQSFVVHDRTVERQYRTSLAAHYTSQHANRQLPQSFDPLLRTGLFSTAHIDRMTKSVFRYNSNNVTPQAALLGTYQGGYYFVRTPLQSRFVIFRQGDNQVALPTDSHEDVVPFTTFLMPSWLPKGCYTIEIVTNEGIWPTALSINNTGEKLIKIPDGCQ
ncbi:MAG: hypothetical protein JWP57_3076 [Spirosoma sp.]|nr:hypothetical protein [Spirosoma sp.]